MYKYTYEKIHCGISGFGLVNGTIYKIDNYRDIIEEKSKEGWRYVGYIPTKQRGTGHIQELDLIFEQIINEKQQGSEKLNDKKHN